MKNQIKIIAVILITALSVNTISAVGKFKKESFKVSGNCEMCKKTIESSLKVDGVEAALWNPDSKKLQVKYDPAVITIDKIHHLVADAGYDTDLVKADEKAYNGLAKCCQYRAGAKCSHE
jgi:copper chaperone CopZ